jgi:hypothetical protein
MSKGRKAPDPKPAPTILALDPAMLEGEPWKRQAYIAQNWQALAGLAWRGYQAWGRGIVVLTTRPEANPQACEYQPLALGHLTGAREQARRFMREYDPETEIVVGFLDPTPTPGNPGGNMLLFQLRAGGSLVRPPDAAP